MTDDIPDLGGLGIQKQLGRKFGHGAGNLRAADYHGTALSRDRAGCVFTQIYGAGSQLRLKLLK